MQNHSRPAIRRRTLIAAAAGTTATAAVVGLQAFPAASATVPRPSIISCADWGAAPARTSISLTGPVTRIIIHHTATANTTDYSRAAAVSLARAIQASHLASGWGDSGQQFTISRGGYALEGRHRSLEGLTTRTQTPFGVHCQGQNSNSVGIENEGLYTSQTPTSAQWTMMVHLCAYLCQTYRLSPAAIKGHRDYNATECPGSALYARLDDLRKEVAARLGQPAPPPSPTRSWPVLSQGATGFRVSAAQLLLQHAGQSLEADGSFGPATHAAVQAFQTAKQLDPDGVIGPLTWGALAVVCRHGEVNEAVRAVQTCLVAQRRPVDVDGSFGPATLAAVKAFQEASGLEADGIVGPITWPWLLS